jgi:hypothetical protein
LRTLVRHGFGIDDRGDPTEWSLHPDLAVLQRISSKSAVPIELLVGMTLSTWAPPYHNDEINERFRPSRWPAQHAALRFVICQQCLEADSEPYLRLPWMLGWLAVCPKHATLMITQCDTCGAKLRADRLSPRSFSPMVCARCGRDLRHHLVRPADPRTIKLQEILLRGKREGATEFDGIGHLSWTETIALADVLIGTFFTDLKLSERHRIHAHFYDQFPVRWLAPANERYANIAFLASLTDDWPRSLGAQVAKDMISQWDTTAPARTSRHPGHNYLITPRNPPEHEIEPSIRNRLRQLIQCNSQ